MSPLMNLAKPLKRSNFSVIFPWELTEVIKSDLQVLTAAFTSAAGKTRWGKFLEEADVEHKEGRLSEIYQKL